MRIFKLQKKNYRRFSLVLTAILFLVIGGKVLADWGPSRPTYTWAHPADHITFNSITDNPVIGDERAFATGKTATDVAFHDPVTVHNNDEVSISVYFHNNAASSLNLVAQNTKVRILLPNPNSAKTETFASADISADNATPQKVWDTVDIKGNQPFTLEYVRGSARLVNGVFTAASGGTALSDDVVSSGGTLVGYNAIDGKVPGCSQFSGYVNIKVRVHMQTPPVSFGCTGLDVTPVSRTRFGFTAHGTATNATIQSYNFIAKNSAGQVVDNQTVVTSASSANYTFDQSTPDTYSVSAIVNTDQGSTNPADCSKQITVQAMPFAFACTGLDVNSVSRTKFDFTAHALAQNATVQAFVFTAKDSKGNVVDTKTVNTNALSATYNFNQSKPDTYTISAQVKTDKGDSVNDCSKQITVAAKAAFACDALDVKPGNDRSVAATVRFSVSGGASLKMVSFDWGDGSTPLVTTNTSANHTYGKDDNFTIKATLTFNNPEGTDQNSICSQPVSFTTPPTTPPATPQVGKNLPNTGPGSVASLFAGVSVFTGFGHYILTRRSKQ